MRKISKYFEYVKTKMLYQVKENMICVWIDQDRHFDNTVTNKIEHAHSRFKKYFLDSKSDFCKGWKSMNNMIVLHQKKRCVWKICFEHP